MDRGPALQELNGKILLVNPIRNIYRLFCGGPEIRNIPYDYILPIKCVNVVFDDIMSA